MMQINKLISMFMLFCTLFTHKTVDAQEKINDYEYIIAGQCVYQNGFFFSEPGMANLYLSVDEKIKLAILDKQKEVSKLKLDLDACLQSKLFEIKIQKEMYEKQLIIKQQVIDNYSSEKYWDNLKIVGYTAIGVGAGFLLGYVFALK